MSCPMMQGDAYNERENQKYIFHKMIFDLHVSWGLLMRYMGVISELVLHLAVHYGFDGLF